MSIGRNLLLVAAVCVLALTLGLGVSASVSSGHEPDSQTASNEEIIRYYESGHYAKDTAAVGRRARRSLRRQLDGKPSDGDDAIVFDVDDTALSSYECQKRLGSFGSAEEALCVGQAGFETTTGTGKGLPAIGPVRRLYLLAQRKAVRVFFVTARPDFSRPYTIDNLRAQGYTGPFTQITQGDVQYFRNVAEDNSLVPYKSGARAKIERRGYRILVNIGDQESDLEGGHAVRAFKVPNPMYHTD